MTLQRKNNRRESKHTECGNHAVYMDLERHKTEHMFKKMVDNKSFRCTRSEGEWGSGDVAQHVFNFGARYT